jgi:hypothetical protein
MRDALFKAWVRLTYGGINPLLVPRKYWRYL